MCDTDIATTRKRGSRHRRLGRVRGQAHGASTAATTSTASSRRRYPRLAAAAVVLSTVAAAGGCGVGNAVNEAVNALTQAQLAIEAGSANWQVTLSSITTGLSKDARDLIEGPVQQLAQRSAAAVQTNVACIIDMVDDRVTGGLQRIKASLLNQAVTPPTPSVCSLSPSDISLGAPVASRQKIEAFGYDFFASPLKVQHVTKSGVVDLPGVLSVQTSYHLTLNLSELAIGPQSTALRIVGTKGVDALIPVIQAPVRPCAVKTTVVPVADVTVPASQVRGDAEFFGNGPSVNVSFAIQNLGSSIQGTLRITAQETMQNPFRPLGTYLDGDTYGEGSASWSIYEPPPGWYVVSFTPSGSEERYSSRDTSPQVELRTSSGGTVLRQWVIVGDVIGPDLGVANGTSVTARFANLSVTLAEVPGNAGCAKS